MNSTAIYRYIGPKRFYHYVFWLIAISSHMVDHIGIIEKAGMLPYLGLVVERNGLLMMIVYANFYYLIPKLFPSNKITYWLTLFVAMALFAFVHAEYKIWLLNNYSVGTGNPDRPLYHLFANFLNAGRFVLVSVLLKFTVDWFDQQKELAQAKVDKLQAELRYLKNRINPHFLFNTLNNMYALALKKSEKTPDVILRLSEMMAYMLYDGNEDKVRLAKDVEHLDNYIELERIRSSQARFSFEKSGEIGDQPIAPFLLLPLVENVFKHGVNATDAKDAGRAFLKVENDTLFFEIENPKKAAAKNSGNGTGLENLRKRLNHIYAGKYSLAVEDIENRFRATLKINLA